MTAASPPQGTGHPITDAIATITGAIPILARGRRRAEHVPPSVVPGVVQLAAAVAAVGFGWAAAALHDPAGIVLALASVGIVVAAFGPDIDTRWDAWQRARIDAAWAAHDTEQGMDA